MTERRFLDKRINEASHDQDIPKRPRVTDQSGLSANPIARHQQRVSELVSDAYKMTPLLNSIREISDNIQGQSSQVLSLLDTYEQSNAIVKQEYYRRKGGLNRRNYENIIKKKMLEDQLIENNAKNISNVENFQKLDKNVNLPRTSDHIFRDCISRWSESDKILQNILDKFTPDMMDSAGEVREKHITESIKVKLIIDALSQREDYSKIISSDKYFRNTNKEGIIGIYLTNKGNEIPVYDWHKKINHGPLTHLQATEYIAKFVGEHHRKPKIVIIDYPDITFNDHQFTFNGTVPGYMDADSVKTILDDHDYYYVMKSRYLPEENIEQAFGKEFIHCPTEALAGDLVLYLDEKGNIEHSRLITHFDERSIAGSSETQEIFTVGEWKGYGVTGSEVNDYSQRWIICQTMQTNSYKREHLHFRDGDLEPTPIPFGEHKLTEFYITLRSGQLTRDQILGPVSSEYIDLFAKLDNMGLYEIRPQENRSLEPDYYPLRQELPEKQKNEEGAT